VAQVYQFVDDNGVTRLFAEIVPDPAGTPFNGGTITAPLTIDDPAVAAGSYQLLDVAMAGAGQDALVVTDVRDGAGNDVVAVSVSASGTGNANVSVNDDAGFGSAVLDSQAGISYLSPSDGATVFTVTPTTLGFYRHAPVAQQTGVAVTAAAIHAALVNLGLITA